MYPKKTVESEANAQVRALLGARQLILDGALAPGGRVYELDLVERLGLSRTPVRMALVRLNEEGFLAALPAGGFVVRSFSDRDVFDAIDLRGTLEGMAARLGAERGVAQHVTGRMRAIAHEIHGLLTQSTPDEDVAAYVRLNDEFHALLWKASGSEIVEEAVRRVVKLPFAAPNGFSLSSSRLAELAESLLHANRQHQDLVEALADGEGSRAEALAREHAREAARYMRAMLKARRDDPTRTRGALRLIET